LDSAVPPAVEVAVFSDFKFELADPFRYFDIGVSSFRFWYFFSGEALIDALWLTWGIFIKINGYDKKFILKNDDNEYLHFLFRTLNLLWPLKG
jgi:hypothetical protein